MDGRRDSRSKSKMIPMNDIATDHVGPMQNPPHLGDLIRESMEHEGSAASGRTGRPKNLPCGAEEPEPDRNPVEPREPVPIPISTM